MNLSVSQFLTLATNNLSYEGLGFEDLETLFDISLDDALAGIESALDAALDPSGIGGQALDLPGMTDEMVDYLTAVYEQDVALIAQMPDVDFIVP